MITCIAVWSTGQTRVPGLRPEFRADSPMPDDGCLDAPLYLPTGRKVEPLRIWDELWSQEDCHLRPGTTHFWQWP